MRIFIIISLLLLTVFLEGCMFPSGPSVRRRDRESSPLVGGVCVGYCDGGFGQGHQVALLLNSIFYDSNRLVYLKHTRLKNINSNIEDVLTLGSLGGAFRISMNYDFYFDRQGSCDIGYSIGWRDYVGFASDALGVSYGYLIHFGPDSDGSFDFFGQASLQLWWQF